MAIMLGKRVSRMADMGIAFGGACAKSECSSHEFTQHYTVTPPGIN